MPRSRMPAAGPRSPDRCPAALPARLISTLRLRLAIEGDLGKSEGDDPADLTAGMFSQKWGNDLTAAVKRFQVRHGLKDTGVVAGATLKALNVPARTRFTELASSAQRLAGRNISFADRYVVVNIPSASVEAVENGKVVHRYVAVVGGPDHASPEVDAKVQAVNLNPTWTVPTSIIKNEIIPHMQRDPSYLSREHIRILDGAGNVINARSVDWNSQKATNYICGRTPARRTRSATSASTCPTNTPCTCMTRRRSASSAATTASCRTAASVSKGCSTSRPGCSRA